MIDQRSGRNRRYVNHDEEMARWAAELDGLTGIQLVVIEGQAGVGKSATATEFTYRVGDRYPDGCLVGDLSGALGQDGAESEVLYGFLLGLDVPTGEIPDRLDARRVLFQKLTRGRRLAMILDGATSASQVRTLLPGEGDSLVVVTEGRSLSALVTDHDPISAKLSPLTAEAATDLLARLAGAERVEAEPDAVAEVVRLCWYLPIALCVVGAMMRRNRSRTFATMVERLRDERRRLDTLSGGELSVRAVFTAAHRQLGEAAQTVYRAFGLRPRTSAISVAALAAVLRLPEYEIVEAMDELLEAHLVEPISERRFRVREAVQLHAEDLDTRSEQDRDAEVGRLLDFYHQRSVDADHRLAPGRPWRRKFFPELRPRSTFDDEAQAREWLRDERLNLRAAIEFLAEVGEADRVAQWCVLLWPFYEKEKQYVDDLFAVHRLGLKACRSSEVGVRSLLHTQLAFGHYWLRDLDEAVDAFRTGLELAKEARDEELEATAAEGLGLAELARGNVEQAGLLLARNLEIASGIAEERRLALARFHLAKAESPETALDLLRLAASTFRERNEVENVAKVDLWTGKKLLDKGDTEAARPALERALVVMSERGRHFDEAEIQDALGDLAAKVGEPQAALACYEATLSCYERLGFATLAERIGAKISALPR
ncbi:NB-ARC domain-containing protein [Amycolatopsis xylanica]|uniref:NB-ARC domain-containing protein n=1 Tax=Amycolatopsis xylanica TaxID=589385 RepID=A0A1H3JLD4_9PSEU|nr:NB-ARC domain-containing protein [Amycolatopsis xylanica]SDY40800.1 NB-ARC domain-containing protein [Amycolatopsis xylanica]